MKEQVKSLFQEYVKAKRLELKSSQETVRMNCYGYPTQLRGIIQDNQKVKEKLAELKEGVKKLFKSWRVVSLDYQESNYGYIPTPSYYDEKFDSRTVNFTLKLQIDGIFDCYGHKQSIYENFYFTFPFTGELKKLTLSWVKDSKEYWELEQKHKKLTEFENNLDNHVNIFLLKNQNPELYAAAESFVCDVINGIDREVEK
jgi:hypothetical protein